jgi:hypothetical protein
LALLTLCKKKVLLLHIFKTFPKWQSKFPIINFIRNSNKIRGNKINEISVETSSSPFKETVVDRLDLAASHKYDARSFPTTLF